MQQPVRAGRGWARLMVAAGLGLGLAACGRGPTPATPTPTPGHTAAPVLAATTELVAPPPATTLAPYPPPPTATLEPYPNGTARYTSTPTFTPYPTPLPTDTTTPEPTAMVVPPVQTVTADTLPVLARDVLFPDRGQLMRWHGATGQIETLLAPTLAPDSALSGEVRQFALSPDGQTVAIERTGALTDTFVVDLFRLDTRQLMPVHAGAPAERGLLAQAFSPDGLWLAYIIRAAPAEGAASYSQTGTIYLVSTAGPNQPITIGPCSGVATDDYTSECLRGGRLVWSPDSSTLAWNDSAGVWLAPPGAAPTLLLANLPAGAVRGEVAYYTPQSWSPTGRYLLLRVGHYEGSHLAVLDIESGVVSRVPNSDEYPWPVARATWTLDDRLFVVRSLQATEDTPYALAGEVWRIDPAAAALVLDQLFPIVEAAAGNPAAVGPAVLPNGQLVWGVVSASREGYATRGLYRFVPGDIGSQKLTGLPVSSAGWTVEIAWLPDGSAALVHFGESRTTLYAPTDGSALYDLTSALGEGVCCFAWLN